MNNYEKYRLGTTIQRQDGTFDYCVEELVEVIFNCPAYKEIFRGTKKECEKKKLELDKECE